ncbi:MAG: GMC family oxidoreductase N-terminal domain-containing protein [Kofleriaceae bacterium]
MAARLAEALQDYPEHKIVMLEKGYDWHGVDPQSSNGERNEFGTRFKQSDEPDYLAKIYHHYTDKAPGSVLSGSPTMHVLAGKGVGGGSLVNCAVAIRAPSESFEHRDDFDKRRWPTMYTRSFLNQYYTRAEQTLNAQPLSWTSGSGPEWARPTYSDHVFAKGCLKAGITAQPLTLAMKDCKNCGWCYSGCAFDAKTGANYFKRAHQLGVRIDSECDVYEIAPAGGSGYVVSYFDRRSNQDKTIECKLLILGAGAVGTTGLMLASKTNFYGARELSWTLGKHVSANGDYYVGGLVGDEYAPLNTHQGKVLNSITWSYWEQYQFVIQCLSYRPWLSIYGLPSQLAEPNYPNERGREVIDPATLLYGPDFKNILAKWSSHLLGLLIIGIDQAEGEIQYRLGPTGYAPSVEWSATHPKTQAMWDKAIDASSKIFEGLGGKLLADVYRDRGIVTAPHVVGGCRMGENTDMGVVDPYGEVFGNKNLFVVDGAALPQVGVNPYLTISAVAEHNAERLQSTLLERLA